MSDYTALWNGDFSKLDVVAESVDVYHHAASEYKQSGNGREGGTHGLEDYQELKTLHHP
ncbi:MAG: hypothetical protein R6V38_06780 [Roseovarius gahaiensis]